MYPIYSVMCHNQCCQSKCILFEKVDHTQVYEHILKTVRTIAE